jgi:D-amino-acid dehydrogenase
VPVAVPGLALQVPGWLIDPKSPLSVRWAYLPRAVPWLLRLLLAGNEKAAHRSASVIAPLTLGALDAWSALLSPADQHKYLRVNGQLLVSRSVEMGKGDRFSLDLRRKNGVNVQEIGAEDIRRLEPGLSKDYQWGLYVPDSGHLTNPKAAIEALFNYFLAEGGEFQKIEVSGLIRDNNGSVVAITTNDTELEVGQVVFAAGAYSGRFAALIGDRIPLDTERGYNVTIPRPGVELNRPTSDVERRYFATSMSTGLRIAGTVEIAGLNAAPRYERAEMLLKHGCEMLPELDTANAEFWMGRRPSIPDSIPVIGRSARAENAWYAFGHGHIGVTTAPTTGRLLSELVSDLPRHISPDPYTPSRFC